MTLFALIRHAPTEWNESGRVQSRTDVPLSAAGRAAAREWRVPDLLRGFDWISSPLSRAIETAHILTGTPPARTDPRLVEMDWGAWEGMDLHQLRAEIGNPSAAWREGGLDFLAPRGESQRDVQARLLALFREIAEAERPTIAVCHRGVVRATYSLAIDWDQTTPWPDKLDDECAHLFRLSADGTPVIERLNLPLAAAAGG